MLSLMDFFVSRNDIGEMQKSRFHAHCGGFIERQYVIVMVSYEFSNFQLHLAMLPPYRQFPSKSQPLSKPPLLDLFFGTPPKGRTE